MRTFADTEKLTSRKIKDLCIREGALIAGIAAVEKFGGNPPGLSPADKFSGCRSMIVLGSRLPKELLFMDADEYTRNRADAVEKLDTVARNVEKHLKTAGFGAKAVKIINERRWEPDYWDHISMNRAAEHAGLGRIIRNQLLTNPVYGNMLWFAAVLTDESFTPDQVMDEELCLCRGCGLCVVACPAGALNDPEQLNRQACDKFRCRVIDDVMTVVCYECRRACPLRFGVPAPPNAAE